MSRGQGVRTFVHFADNYTACVSAESRGEVQITIKDWRKEVKGEFSVMFHIPKVNCPLFVLHLCLML